LEEETDAILRDHLRAIEISKYIRDFDLNVSRISNGSMSVRCNSKFGMSKFSHNFLIQFQRRLILRFQSEEEENPMENYLRKENKWAQHMEQDKLGASSIGYLSIK
jgi:hypothetical protein